MECSERSTDTGHDCNRPCDHRSRRNLLSPCCEAHREATQANRDLLAANELLPDSITANPDDLLIVVKADQEDSALEAIGKVDELLTRRKSSGVSQDFRPHSLSAAVNQLPEANWVLISVPGRHAAAVAREALARGFAARRGRARQRHR